jgi:hypothetical protein
MLDQNGIAALLFGAVSELTGDVFSPTPNLAVVRASASVPRTGGQLQIRTETRISLVATRLAFGPTASTDRRTNYARAFLAQGLCARLVRARALNGARDTVVTAFESRRAVDASGAARLFFDAGERRTRDESAPREHDHGHADRERP